MESLGSKVISIENKNVYSGVPIKTKQIRELNMPILEIHSTLKLGQPQFRTRLALNVVQSWFTDYLNKLQLSQAKGERISVDCGV